MRGLFVGCIAYANDLFLLSGSVALLQKMLNMCSGHADQLDIQFNTKKSCLLHIANSFNKKDRKFTAEWSRYIVLRKLNTLVYILYLENLLQ